MVFPILHKTHCNGHIQASQLCNKLKYSYYNIPEDLCKIFTSLCPICLTNTPRVKPLKGTSTPIISTKYRDRYQADLIDYRNAPALLYSNDTESPICLWLLVVKDHFTRFTILQPLMKKEASHVALEIDFICSIIGYPIIFQTNNYLRFLLHQLH